MSTERGVDGQDDSDDRHDRRAAAGSGDLQAPLAAEAGRLKAKVDRLVAWPPAQPPTARHLGKPK
jgi:hypothetical protein